MNFAVVGIAGYIAQRHLEAIRDLGHTVMAGVDVHDSAGRLDWFDLNIRFSRSMALLQDLPLDYVSICTPNYLHAEHVEVALRYGHKVIVEKPTVTNPDSLDRFEGREVSTISQLRIHSEVVRLKQELDKSRRYSVQLNYCAPRGMWYKYSWQSNPRFSGGLPMSIGFHMFDLLLHLFGPVETFEVIRSNNNLYCSGRLALERADVEWKLTTVPQDKELGRTITIDGEAVDLSSSFTALHTEAYRQILAGNGLTIQDVRPTIKLCHQLATL